MKQEVVSVFDSAMQAYSRPFFVPTVAMAVRSFKDEVNRSDPQNAMYVHPDDFELRYLATFDEETGVFTTEGVRVLVRAKDVKENGK